MIQSLGAFENYVYSAFFLYKNSLGIVNVSILFATVPFTFAEEETEKWDCARKLTLNTSQSTQTLAKT